MGDEQYEASAGRRLLGFKSAASPQLDAEPASSCVPLANLLLLFISEPEVLVVRL